MRRVEDKYVIRLPDGMRDQIKALAKVNRRSMNAEIIIAIEARMEATAGGGPRKAAPAAADPNTAVDAAGQFQPQ
ncbi:Arc family DNA-binding protein [Castellaniella sp.]|uniref:Arc family DNA-binding protein n=1 Tax=Castellaniella sp. TaxID=1955812 RepID=UPI003A598A35